MPTKRTPSSQVWLCLRFTYLSLNRVDINSESAFAVTHQQKVWQCNSSALRSGITNGMSISHALMLNSNLQLQERDLQLEIKKLQELSYWGYRYTSLVSQQNDNTLLLEIGKSVKLFNNLKHLIHLIKEDLISFKIDANLGLATTPKAAIILSIGNHQNFSQNHKALARTKLEHLEQDHKTIQKLRHCGFQTLDDLKDIPHAELGSRFGQQLLIYLRQLWGDLADPQIAITPPETFHASADFAEPINNITWLQQQLDRLLDDLVYFIKLRQLLCRSFTWHFYHENSRLVKTVEIGVSSGQNLNSTFKELSKLKLESTTFEWEFSSIALSSANLLPIQLFNDDLFNPNPKQEQFQQLLDKLISRLGHSAVFHLTQEDEYLPELSNKRICANKQHLAETSTIYHKHAVPNNELSNKHIFKDEPLWLLEKPIQLMKHMQLPILDGPLTIIHGPNRITSHWWETLQSRDYFIARQRSGRLLWVFFDRINKSWYLHGLYG